MLLATDQSFLLLYCIYIFFVLSFVYRLKASVYHRACGVYLFCLFNYFQWIAV